MFGAILFAVILLAVSVVCLIKRRFGVAMFNAVWAIVFLISCREFSMEQYGLTQLLLCLMVVMINAGYWWANFRSEKSLKTDSECCSVPSERTLNEKVLLVMLIVSCVIFAWYAVQTVRIFGFNLGEIRGYNNADNEGSAFSSRIDTILFYGVATPLIYTSILSFAYSFSQNVKVKIRFYAIALVAVLLQMITTGGGRSIILRSALFFAAAIIMRFISQRNVSVNKKKLAIFGGVAAAMLILLEVVTLIRNEGEISFVGQTIAYIRGAVGHMQYRLTRPMEHQYYGGFLTFGGFLYYPIKLLNVLAGTEFQTSNEILAYLQAYREVTLYDQTIQYNALVPNAFYFFRDNGYVGVVALSFLHGWLMHKAEKNIANPTFLRFVMWATCVYMIVYSPLDGVLWTFRHPTTIICCLILNRFLYKPVGNTSTEEK